MISELVASAKTELFSNKVLKQSKEKNEHKLEKCKQKVGIQEQKVLKQSKEKNGHKLEENKQKVEIQEQKVLNKLQSLSGKKAQRLGILHSKYVNIKAERACLGCGRTIIANERALTCTGIENNKHVRHWICNSCASALIPKNNWLTQEQNNKIKSQKEDDFYKKLISMPIKEFNELSEETQLKFAQIQLKRGDISLDTYDDIVSDIIDSMAFRDALMNEF